MGFHPALGAVIIASSLITNNVVAQKSAFVRVAEFAHIESFTTAVLTLNVSQVVAQGQQALTSLQGLRAHMATHGIKLHPLQDDSLRRQESHLQAALGHVAEDSQILSRPKRDINLDMHMDVSSMISETFNGLSNLFYGSNFKELEAQIKQADFKLTTFAGASTKTMRRMSRLIQKTNSIMINTRSEALSLIERDAAVAALGDVMAFAIRHLALLDHAGPALAKGQIPGSLVPLWQAQALVTSVKTKARQSGLESAVESAVDMYTLPAILKAEEAIWVVLMKFPLVKAGRKRALWRFLPLPVTNLANEIVVPSPIFSLLVPPEGLEADMTTIAMSQDDFDASCQMLSGRAICTPTPVFRNGFLPCIALLWNNDQEAKHTCSFRKALQEDHLPRRVGTTLILFPEIATSLSLECGDIEPKVFAANSQQLLWKEIPTGCTVKSNEWEMVFPKDAGQPVTKSIEVIPPWEKPSMVTSFQKINEIQKTAKTDELIQDLQTDIIELEQLISRNNESFLESSGWDVGDVTSTTISSSAALALVAVLLAACWKRSHKPPGIRVTMAKEQTEAKD